MVVTKPRLSLVSSVSLYQLTYLYWTYFWDFIHEICVSKESNIIKDILLDNKKTNLLSLATCNLRNYSGEKFFLWILRFVGVWNICKNPRKFRNRVCLIFFLHKIMRSNINVTFDTTFFLFYVLTFVYITSLHLVEFAYHTKDLWLEIDSISWQHPPFLDVLLNASQNFLV